MIELLHKYICWFVGGAAFIAGYFIRFYIGKWNRRSNENIAEKIIKEAKTEVETKRKEARLEAKEEIYKVKAELEKEMKERRQDSINLEKRVLQKEENVEKRSDLVNRKETDLQNREKLLKVKEQELELSKIELKSLLESEQHQLQKVSGLSRDEARQTLLSKLEEDLKGDVAQMIRHSESQIREDIHKKAQRVMTEAIQRCVVDHVEMATVTTIALPNDDIKGKIIGRDGRNIRSFEAATGVDLIIDDTPETVVISAFDMVRREIARSALDQLIKDGRIHPARIEEIVEKVKKEMEESIRQAGEEAVFQLGLPTVHPEIVKLVGRLKYRTSYGQNVLEHSKEVAWLFGMIASEMGMNAKTAKRIGLFHDIGKALSHEVEGSHALIGGEIARKYNESEEVVSGIIGHHADQGEQSIWGVLCQAADAISAARPGARSDTVVNYLQRLEKLEGIANAFKGVEKSYAIQAGREIRVIVKPDQVSDDAALVLSRDIANKIQGELQFPGMIKVTVVREMRAIEYAK